ncbi:MAG TPA: zf-TFIIB domain-containing protein [Candidatus Limnocylindrales bacterium]|nr:zf-TFIIB domain-containing protein [Candidatus Limnocylindrales bacterium]
MSETRYHCPQCRTPLAALKEGDFDAWQCPEGHGIGVTLTEAYGHFQDDEIHAIWTASKSAPKSTLKSPVLGSPMVAVTVVVDDDEIEGNEGPGAHLVTLDVAPDEQFLWIHVADFRGMPTDLPNPPPSAEQRARLDELGMESRASIGRDLDSRETDESRLGYRVGSWAAAKLHMTGLVNRLGASAKARMNKPSA